MGADAPKAFVRCAGRELWEWSAEVLARECDRVLMAVPADRAGTGAGVAGVGIRRIAVPPHWRSCVAEWSAEDISELLEGLSDSQHLTIQQMHEYYGPSAKKVPKR